MPPPWVIILNGVGSVGKTSTARALQAASATPLLHVSMDAFLDMLPPRLLDHPDGLQFDRGMEDGHPSIAIRSGPVLARAMAGMRAAIAGLAGAGNHLIIDDVITNPAAFGEYRALLAATRLRWVGLFAPLDVLEARERARGDREIGLARWQLPRLHAGITYDLSLDMAALTPEAAAERIRAAFSL